MKISIIVEGRTEGAFVPILRTFLQKRLAEKMPRLDIVPQHGRVDKGEKLKRVVLGLLTSGRCPADAVIALTDVYTGTKDFASAQDAKEKMRQWVGVEEKRFYPHAAQHDFEAWLLPYWQKIKRISGSNRAQPHGEPESVNHNNPPSYRLKEVFINGSKRRAYVKVRDALSIFRDEDLSVAIAACPELKAFVNTILILCDAEIIT